MGHPAFCLAEFFLGRRAWTSPWRRGFHARCVKITRPARRRPNSIADFLGLSHGTEVAQCVLPVHLSKSSDVLRSVFSRSFDPMAEDAGRQQKSQSGAPLMLCSVGPSRKPEMRSPFPLEAGAGY
jgi:hypothetical protein